MYNDCMDENDDRFLTKDDYDRCYCSGNLECAYCVALVEQDD